MKQAYLLDAPVADSEAIIRDENSNIIDDDIIDDNDPVLEVNLDSFPTIIEFVKGSLLQDTGNFQRQDTGMNTFVSLTEFVKMQNLTKYNIKHFK